MFDRAEAIAFHPQMATDPNTVTEHRPPGGRAWVRPAALVVACLIIGFVGGWVLRGDDGPTTVLAASTPAAASRIRLRRGGDHGAEHDHRSGGRDHRGRASPPPRRTAPRSSLVVLNGTDTAGLAGDTAAQAESFGYKGVTAANAPAGTTGPSVVYYREGQRAAAERVATDLEFDQVRQLPGSGALCRGGSRRGLRWWSFSDPVNTPARSGPADRGPGAAVRIVLARGHPGVRPARRAAGASQGSG